MTSRSNSKPRPDNRTGQGTVLLGAAFAALGAFVLFEALAGPATSSYARVGPSFFPALVGGATVLVGLCLVLQAIRGRWSMMLADDAADGDAVLRKDLPAFARIALVVAGLAANVLLMQPLGFIIASATMYVCATRAFGSRALVRNALIGLTFAALIHGVFRYVLGIGLPSGWMWD